MKNNQKIVTIAFLVFILFAQISLVVIPTAKGFSLYSFTALDEYGRNPSQVPLLQDKHYEFTLTATLPGGSGSNGVDVYVIPPDGTVVSGVTVTYQDTISNGTAVLGHIKIPPGGSSGTTKMFLDVALDATPSEQSLTVTGFDNPGAGGTYVGAFTVTLHVNEALLTVQTNLPSSYPTNVYIDGVKQAQTASENSPFTMYFPISEITGLATTGTVGVDSSVAGNGVEYVFSGWQLDGVANGTNNPHTSLTMSEQATLTALFTSKPVTHLSVVASPSTINAGGSMSITVTALAVDSTVITGYIGTVHFTSTDTNAAVILPSDYTFTGNDQGVHTFSNGVTLATVGAQTVTATDTVTPSIAGTSNSIAVSAGESSTVTHLDASATPNSVTAGQTVSVTVTAKDQYDNIVPAYSSIVHFTSTDDQASLPANTVLASGTGIFSATLKTTGAQTITATDTLTQSITGTSNAVTVITGDSSTVNHFDVTATPSFITAGQSVSVTVTAKDQYDNTVPAYSGIVNFTSTDNQAILPANSGLTNGVGVFTVILKTAGNQTITVTDAATTSTTGTSNSVQVTANTNSPGRIDITPKTTAIEAGKTVTYTAELFDIFGNSLGDITNAISAASGWSVDVDAGGSWAGNIYAAEMAGSWTVTGTLEGVSGSVSLIVTHSSDVSKLASVTVAPSSASVEAGKTQDFTATAKDTFGNEWDVTDVSVWAVSNGAGGSWAGNFYTAEKAGSWTVTATFEGVSGTASLTVTHSTDATDLVSVVVAPSSASVEAGKTQGFTATAKDSFGNEWDVTSLSVWSIDIAAGGHWVGAAYTAETAGSWTVTGTFMGVSGTASLTVSHSTDVAKLDYIVLAPKAATINAGVSQSYTATAYDTFGNSWTIDAVYSCPNSTVAISGSAISSNLVGSYTITGTYNGKSDTATLMVIANPDELGHITISPKSSRIPAGSSQSYSVEAFDVYNNNLGIVTSSTIFTAQSATVTENSVSASGGTYTVTATYQGKTDTATLSIMASTSSSSSSSTSSPPTISTYTVTFTELGLPQDTTWNITFNSITKTSNTSTISFSGIRVGQYSWNTTTAVIIQEQTTRYVSNQSEGTLNVSTDLNVELNYTTQYYLTVISENGNPTGQGWYKAGSIAAFSVDEQVTDSSGAQSFFAGWIGTGEGSYSGQEATQTVTMNNPITEAASWEQATSLYLYLLVLIIILAILTVLYRYRHRLPLSKLGALKLRFLQWRK